MFHLALEQELIENELLILIGGVKTLRRFNIDVKSGVKQNMWVKLSLGDWSCLHN